MHLDVATALDLEEGLELLETVTLGSRTASRNSDY